MIYQFEEFFSVEVAPYDLCIIGSGPSGITLGLELLYEGLRICTIAGGDFKESSFFRQLKEVEAPYLEVKEVSRIRAFGGTSNTWTGHLAPLDPIDRASRGGIQPGWPYEADPVTAINTRGHRYDLPQLSLFDLNDQLSLEPWPNELKGLREKIFLVQRRPLKFGVKYKYAYLRENFDLLIGAVVTSLESQQKSNKRHVTSVIVKSSGGRSKRILAKKYVLAAGCIENVRLLFSSKDEVGVALGNSYDQLGRRFINHPKADVGEVHFNHGLARAHPLFKLQRAHFRGYVGLRLEESLQETEGLLNSYLRLIPLTRRLLNLKAAVKSTFEINLRDAILSAVAALASRGSVKCARVRCFMDMEASPENRITLSDRLDSLGVAIPIVRYSVSERALNSVRALIDRFSRELSDLGIGKFKPYASFLSGLVKWEDASHHLGGTPMGEDPRTSVVNSELRLHGVDNVYVAGGSVFPTGGVANPTLTIIGLSLRLADTLRSLKPKPDFKVHGDPARRHGIIIVGAGRRVAEDVVPAIEALGETAHIESIYATRPGVIFGRQKSWDVKPIEALQRNAIASASAIYVAVPRDSVEAALAAIRWHDCRKIRLIIDTPAVSSKILDTDYERFLSVHVAEDSITLPWLAAVHSCIDDTSRIREIRFLNSAYRYHAIALAKSISREDLGQGGAVKRAYRVGNRSRLKMASGCEVVLHGPRNYEAGRLDILLEDGRVVSSHRGTDVQIECVREDNRCIGFSVASSKAYLSEIERDLVGRCTANDNVVTRMLDFKRVGLYRLMASILSNGANYSLADGLEDATVDRALAHRRFYYRMKKFG